MAVNSLRQFAETTEGTKCSVFAKELFMAVKIVLEPDLEKQVIGKSWVYRRELARVYARWSRQLDVSSRILRLSERPRPKPRLKVYPAAKLVRN